MRKFLIISLVLKSKEVLSLSAIPATRKLLPGFYPSSGEDFLRKLFYSKNNIDYLSISYNLTGIAVNLYKNHISFNSGQDTYQICQPILTAFQFSHFTYCKKFHNGSRAILTTTPESLYDLYMNKKYIFSKEYQAEQCYQSSKSESIGAWTCLGGAVPKPPISYLKVRSIRQ